MSFSSPVLGCLLKKWLTKGGGGGGLWAPQDPLAMPLVASSLNIVNLSKLFKNLSDDNYRQYLEPCLLYTGDQREVDQPLQENDF